MNAKSRPFSRVRKSSIAEKRLQREFRPRLMLLEDRRMLATTLLPGFSETVVTTGLSAPTAMEFSPDGRLWALEQGGNVKLIHGDGTTFTALHESVDSAGERGLLGIAFDPNFTTNHFVYLYYTNPNPGGAPWANAEHNQLSRFTVNDANPLQPTFTNEAPILDWNNLISATNHNGGAIHFGKDGMLYADAGDNTQTFTAPPPDNGTYRVSQSLGTLLGKQLRIDVSAFSSGKATRDDTTVGDLIASDNPFVGVASGINQLIYVLGLRNPFTFAVQPGTGRILINDVGETTWEEIDDDIAGGNYGWSGGNTDGFGHQPPAFAAGTYHDPLLAYTHSGTASLATGSAIVGGTFYNPANVQFPSSYVGMYFYEDLSSGWIRYFNPNTPNTAASPDGNSVQFATGTPGNLHDLKVDSLGNLYYLTATDGSIRRISYQAPVIVLSSDAGSPNYTTTWSNSGPVPIESMVQASITSPAGAANLASLTVKLATFHTGDVLAVPILPGITALTTSYVSGVLTIAGNDTLAHYQQELRFINYNNTAGGPGVGSQMVTFVGSDGARPSVPVTATINVSVASGNVLGNRLFYNNSKYDGDNAAIGASDDLAIAPDKAGFSGGGTATFSSISSFNNGITGIMVDLKSGIGTHAAINLTSADITFKLAPATFVAGTYNQLSTWTTAPTPSAISVRMGAGTGGSDRLEITWPALSITNTWLEVDVHSLGHSGLSADDVFYFGSAVGDSGAGDTSALAKTDANDVNGASNNVIGLTTPVWNVIDYTKDKKVDASDTNTAANGTFTLHYIASPTGPFAPDGGAGTPGAATASVAATAAPAGGSNIAVASALNLSRLSSSLLDWLSGHLNGILAGLPAASTIKTIENRLPQIEQTIDLFASKFSAADDALDGLLKDLPLG